MNTIKDLEKLLSTIKDLEKISTIKDLEKVCTKRTHLKKHIEFLTDLLKQYDDSIKNYMFSKHKDNLVVNNRYKVFCKYDFKKVFSKDKFIKYYGLDAYENMKVTTDNLFYRVTKVK